MHCLEELTSNVEIIEWYMLNFSIKQKKPNKLAIMTSVKKLRSLTKNALRYSWFLLLTLNIFLSAGNYCE